MIYLGIKSGLGNQMFQYAFGKAASIENTLNLSLDTSAYARQFARDTPRSFGLQHFNIQSPIATDQETEKFHTKWQIFKRRVKNKILPIRNYEFKPSELRVVDGQYIEGFWQSEKYFEKHSDIIREEFTLKNPLGAEATQALQEIRDFKQKGYETIMVHVRRGDYVTNKHSIALLGVLEPDYFSLAIEKVCSEIDKRNMENGNNSDSNLYAGSKPKHIFFATEDTAWVKQNIKPHINYSFISRPGIYDFEEMVVMSNCDHFVISNSSFSWWAAWLGTHPNKIVAAPKKWIVDPSVNTADATPEEWFRV